MSKATDIEVETPEAEIAEETTAPSFEKAETDTDTAVETELAAEMAEAEPADVPEPAEAAQKPRRRFRISLDDRFLAIAVLFALTASIVTAGLMWRGWQGAQSELDAQRDVRAKAGEYATAFLVYDYQHLDVWQQKLASLSTPEYKAAITDTLNEQKPIAEATKAVASVTIRDVFIPEVDGNNAKAIVISDHLVKTSSGTVTQLGMRTYLELINRKGEWLINGLGYQGLDSQKVLGPDGQPVASNPLSPSADPSAKP
ncbi:hypothetical protein GCM10027589_16020 [Actinocorallia lasiicapitis]